MKFAHLALGAISLLAYSPAQAASNNTPISLLGFVLGQPFEIIPCSLFEPVAPCASERTSFHYGPANIRSFEVHELSVRTPEFLRGIYFIVSVIDGKTEGITLYTTGLSSQSVALQQLIEKFGQPGKLEQKVRQNAFGVAFPYASAFWALGGVQINFEGIVDRTDTGVIQVTTAKLRQELANQARIDRESGPHL